MYVDADPEAAPGRRGGVASMASGAGPTVRRLVARTRCLAAAASRLIMGPWAAQNAGGHAGGSSGNCGRQFYAEGRVLGSRTRLSCRLPL